MVANKKHMVGLSLIPIKWLTSAISHNKTSEERFPKKPATHLSLHFKENSADYEMLLLLYNSLNQHQNF